MKVYKLIDKVYRCEFRLYIGELEEFKNAIRKHDGYPGDDKIGPALAWTVSLSGAIGIWLPKLSMDSPSDIATLTHEFFHAMHFRLYHKCDVEYWLGAAEPAAYYMDFLMNGFLSQIKKNKEAAK